MSKTREQRTKLNTLEWTIYNIIKERSEKGLWTSQIELNELLSKNGFEISLRNTRSHINFIKKNDTIQKIIISSTKLGYKLMSSDEEINYLLKKKIEVLKRLKAIYKDLKRYESNGQCKITFENYERDFVESLLKEK